MPVTPGNCKDERCSWSKALLLALFNQQMVLVHELLKEMSPLTTSDLQLPDQSISFSHVCYAVEADISTDDLSILLCLCTPSDLTSCVAFVSLNYTSCKNDVLHDTINRLSSQEKEMLSWMLLLLVNEHRWDIF